MPTSGALLAWLCRVAISAVEANAETSAIRRLCLPGAKLRWNIHGATFVTLGTLVALAFTFRAVFAFPFALATCPTTIAQGLQSCVVLLELLDLILQVRHLVRVLRRGRALLVLRPLALGSTCRAR